MKRSHIHLNIVNPVWWLLTFRKRKEERLAQEDRTRRLAWFYNTLIDTKAEVPFEVACGPGLRPYTHDIEILDVEPERVFVLGAGS